MSSIIYNYLTDSEKNEIIATRIRSNEYALYNMEVTKVEEQNGDNRAEILSEMDSEIEKLQDKVTALKAEQAKLVL